MVSSSLGRSKALGKIIELPKLERPREKALYYGIEKLSDYELLALLIGSGCKDSSAIDIAYAMLRDSNGLASLVNKPFSDLLSYKGMGKNKAIKIEAAFEIARRFQSLKKGEVEKVLDGRVIYEKMKTSMLFKNSIQEHLYLIILDKQKNIIHQVNLYKGNESSVNYSSLQIIKEVLLHNGHFFYIVHNHPSGILEPSQDDIFFTINLINESRKMKITMLDHLIISENGYYSFLEQSSCFNN